MSQKFKKLTIKKIEVPNKFIMSPIELKDYVDFPVKRIYFITKLATPTGSHCHKIEEEMFVMVQGSCTAVIDQGNGLEKIELRSPTDAIYVGSYVWHHFENFSSDAILLAISSTNYNPDRSDYIEDYDKFTKL